MYKLSTQISNLKSQISNLKSQIHDNRFYKKFLSFCSNDRLLRYLAFFIILTYAVLVSHALGSHPKLGHLIVSSFVFILLARNKFIFNIFVIVVGIGACLYLPIHKLYGGLNLGILLAVVYTTPGEIFDFIKSIPNFIYMRAFVILVIACFLIKLRTRIVIRNNKHYMIVLVIFTVHAFFYEELKKELQKELKKVMPDNSRNFILERADHVYTVYGGYKKFIKDNGYNEMYKTIVGAKSDFHPSDIANKYTTYVVVIGESARRDAHQIHGFYLDNTQFLASTPRIQFNDYIAAGAHTTESLFNMFWLDNINNTNKGNNLIALAKSAGFTTYHLSNQGDFGRFESIVGAFGKTADKYYFSTLAHDYGPIKKDIELLPYVEKAITEVSDKPKLILIHLIGSHTDFCSRTEGNYEHLINNSRKISCYIQTIKQTDKFLADVYGYLQKSKQQTNQDWAMVYFSDHGLSFLDNITLDDYKYDSNLVHNHLYKPSYEVPFIIMDSTMTETKFINQRRTGLHFLDFAGQWLGIKDDLLPNKCNFVSEEECPNPNDVVDANWHIQDYSQLKDEQVNYLYPVK